MASNWASLRVTTPSMSISRRRVSVLAGHLELGGELGPVVGARLISARAEQFSQEPVAGRLGCGIAAAYEMGLEAEDGASGGSHLHEVGLLGADGDEHIGTESRAVSRSSSSLRALLPPMPGRSNRRA